MTFCSEGYIGFGIKVVERKTTSHRSYAERAHLRQTKFGEFWEKFSVVIHNLSAFWLGITALAFGIEAFV